METPLEDKGKDEQNVIENKVEMNLPTSENDSLSSRSEVVNGSQAKEEEQLNEISTLQNGHENIEEEEEKQDEPLLFEGPLDLLKKFEQEKLDAEVILIKAKEEYQKLKDERHASHDIVREAKRRKSLAEVEYGNAALKVELSRKKNTSYITTAEHEKEEKRKFVLSLIEKSQQAHDLQEQLDCFVELKKNHFTEMKNELLPIRKELGKILCDAHIPLIDLDVFVVTWNVGNASPKQEEFESLIPIKDRLYDLVVIGLQECQYELSSDMSNKADEQLAKRRKEKRDAKDLREYRENWSSKRNVGEENQKNLKEDGEKEEKLRTGCLASFRKGAKRAEDEAKRAVTSKVGAHFASALHEHLGVNDYFLVRESELMQMREFVFARIEHRPRISQVEYASQATGIGGMVGNKGGVAVSMKFQDTRLCFVSNHLAAHRKYVTQRNHHAAEILGMVQKKLSTEHASYLSDWDYTFFFGDLNYRLKLDSSDVQIGESENPMKVESSLSEISSSFDQSGYINVQGQQELNKKKADHTSMEREQILDLIERKCWKELMEKDQLRYEQQEARLLMGFDEADVYPFPPTFKVKREIGHSYDENRLPAYCDRILWHCTPSLSVSEYSITQIELFSPEDVTSSDHKPVCSRFSIDLKRQGGCKFGEHSTRFRLNDFLTWPKHMITDRDHASKRGLQIRVSKLAATGLLPAGDLNGLADPYVVAYSTELFPRGTRGHLPAHGVARTRVKFQKLNCTWGDNLVIRCPDYLKNPMDVTGMHLTLSVWDFDTLSHDDEMGEIVLSLDDLVHAFLNTSGVVQLFDGARRPSTYLEGEAANDDDESVLPNNANERRLSSNHYNITTAEGGGGGVGGSGEGKRYYKEKLGDRTIMLQPGEVAFELPIIRYGKKAGVLSGVASLHTPNEVLVPWGLPNFGFGWKCLAYWEQMKNQKEDIK